MVIGSHFEEKLAIYNLLVTLVITPMHHLSVLPSVSHTFCIVASSTGDMCHLNLFFLTNEHNMGKQIVFS